MPAGSLGVLAAVAALAVAGWALRARNRHRHETAAHRVELLPGAAPIALHGGSKGVLLLHGFGDTPQSLSALAARLHGDGWAVRVPLLHGHGTSLQAFTSARADEWLTGARTALVELRSHASHVAVVGQSMGGALATILAAEGDVETLVLLAPYLALPSRASRIGTFHRIVAPFVPYLVSRSESSILDPEARRKALGRGITTPRLLHELALVVHRARAALPSVTAPTLVIHSRNDPRVTAADAEAAFAELGCEEKTLEWVERSGHVISVDFDRDLVAQRVITWLESHVGRA
ncbi:MAG TPA: alpha/beta fold hydrolase [Gemmatimonadaceae bacterium]